jgi:hypothetical protein
MFNRATLSNKSISKLRINSFKMSFRDDSSIASSKRIHSPSKRVSTVVSTTSLRRTKSVNKVMINQYVVEKVLGVGSFAVVKLCKDVTTGL